MLNMAPLRKVETRQDKTRQCKTRYMARVKIKRQVTGDGMRMKTIDKEGVLKLKELKTRILSMEEKLEPFIKKIC